MRWLLSAFVFALVAACHQSGGPSVDSRPETPVDSSRTGAVARPGVPPSVRQSATKSEAIPDPPSVLREFRGVWVASVANIDWPSKRTLTTAQQQSELLAILDSAQALNLNAVIFQVRPAADALYESSIEPWSEYLTGAQGRKPDPYWDPLAFAIREAHARGLELHAWFNPYRARFSDARSPLTANHIARTNPSLVKTYGKYLWMDPGEPAIRARTLKVVLDVVKRYDVDGVHVDDYFYPYPENDRRGKPIPFPDARSWANYQKSGGTLSQSDWRRENVNQLVKELYEGIQRTKPWVRFGISPFGIWRPGFPEQIRGFDAYEKLYADARKWLNEGWLDYITPQLYWPTTKREQAYAVLLDWWASENLKSRHLWPGNFTSRAGASGAGSFSVSELMEQIRVTRQSSGGSGNVHFSMKAFLTNQAAMNDSLSTSVYKEQALTPATSWLKAPAPPVAKVSARRDGGLWRITFGSESAEGPWQWVLRLRTGSQWSTKILPGNTASFSVPPDMDVSAVAVSAVNRVGIEGPPTKLSLQSTR